MTVSWLKGALSLGLLAITLPLAARGLYGPPGGDSEHSLAAVGGRRRAAASSRPNGSSSMGGRFRRPRGATV